MPRGSLRKSGIDRYKGLNALKKILFWIGIICFFAGLSVCIFELSLWPEQSSGEKLYNIISFVFTSGIGIILTTLQVAPNIIKFVRGTWYTGLSVIIIIALIASALLNIVLFSYTSSAYGSSHVQIAKSNPLIKIGVSLPLSGDDRQDGVAILNGIQLAVNETAIGYPVQVVAKDDQGVPSVGEKDVEALISDVHVAGVIGPFNSDVAIREIPKTNASGLALISPATTAACLTGAQENEANIEKSCIGVQLYSNNQVTFFRTVTADNIRGKDFADYLSTIYPHGKVAIFRDTTSFADSLSDAFKSRWKEDGGNTIFDESTVDINDYVASLEGFSSPPNIPNIILFAGTGTSAIEFYRLMQQQPNLSKVAFASTAAIMNPGFTASLKNSTAHSPVYAISPVGNIDGSIEGMNYEASYITQYGSNPTPYSAAGYDDAKILLAAVAEAAHEVMPPSDLDGMGQARLFRGQVVEETRSLNRKNGIQYSGITIHSPFDGNGDVENGQVSFYRFNAINSSWDFLLQEEDTGSD